MTIAEKLINQGMEKGFHNAKSETAVTQLTRKFGGLPVELKARIQRADAHT